MRFETYFRLTSYSLIATPVVALALTNEVDELSIVLYAIALSVSFYADNRGVTRFRLREWMWRVLALGYIPFIFLDAALSSRVIALVHLTLFLSAAKLFQEKRDRDWVFLYLIAFFQMLLAAGLTFDSTFVASLGAFIFFFISTLASFEIRLARRDIKAIDEEIIQPAKKQRRSKARGKELPASPHPKGASPLAGRIRYLVGASLAQVIIIGALTLPLFFMIPRFGGMTRGLADGEAFTGFSEVVELGEVARIKENQQVVMRIRLDKRPNRYLRWRGVALDYYTGKSWKTNPRRGQILRLDQNRRETGGDREKDEQFERSFLTAEWSSNKSAEQRVLLEQRILLEPSASATLFAAQRVMRVRAAVPNMTEDTETGALKAEGVKGRLLYTVLSDISLPDERFLQLDSSLKYPDGVIRTSFQLPSEHRPDEIRLDHRIKELALELTRGARTPYQKAKAIETHLKTGYGYTLEPGFTKRDPLAEFLFEARAGHCEYFATAMTVMMRLLDIPARLVNGFQMGEFNEINGLYTVRASDAHSWVEVYFSDSDSWIEFDPTPPAGINDYSNAGLLGRLRKYLEAAEVLWLDYIVTLDSEQQASMMVELQHRLLGVKDQLLEYYTAVKMWFRSSAASFLDRNWSVADILKLLIGFAVAVLLVIGVYVTSAYIKSRGIVSTGYGPWWHRLFVLPRWRNSRLAARDPRTSAVLFYEQMLSVAAKGGLVKKPEQTPLEFAVESGFPQIGEITAVYNRVRFGGANLDNRETAQVAKLLSELKAATRLERKTNKTKRMKNR
jgi:hypothetical protein